MTNCRAGYRKKACASHYHGKLSCLLRREAFPAARAKITEGRGTAHLFPNELPLVPKRSEMWLTWRLWFNFMLKSHPSQDLTATAWGDLSLPSSTLSQLGVLNISFPLKKINSFLPLSSWSIPLQGQRRTELAQERKRENSPEREEMQEEPYSSIIKIHVSKGCLVPCTVKGSPAQKALSKHGMYN